MESIWNFIVELFTTPITLYIINALLIITVIFNERKSSSAILAWIMVMTFIPVLGFILYLVLNQNISRRKINKMTENEEKVISSAIRTQMESMDDGTYQFNSESTEKWKHLIKLNHVYGSSYYTQDNEIDAVPDGYDELQTLCDEAKKDQKLTEAADIGDYIRAYLNTNYQYNASAPQPPEGADPIRYFLTESKQGYSVQFASAAVVMFRMFGLPARYVVGYAAPQSLFTQQEDGSWHAILQDDNAHAWAEVYISGQGWTPMEMTPGVLVSAQQADLRTDPLPETQGQDTAPAAGESSANEPATTIVPRSRLVLAALLGGCLLAAAVLLVLARRHAMGYGRGSCNARVLAVFGSIYRLLVRRGLPPDTPSDAPEFAAFLQSCVPTLEPQDAEALLALAQAAQFGAGTMTEQDTDKMRKLYQVIKHTGKRKQSRKSVENQSQE